MISQYAHCNIMMKIFIMIYRIIVQPYLVGTYWHCCTETNRGSDWSWVLVDDSNLHTRQWHFAFLRLVSHITVLMLQSHWSAEIPFPGPRIVSKIQQTPFPSLRVGSGHETNLLLHKIYSGCKCVRVPCILSLITKRSIALVPWSSKVQFLCRQQQQTA